MSRFLHLMHHFVTFFTFFFFFFSEESSGKLPVVWFSGEGGAKFHEIPVLAGVNSLPFNSGSFHL